MAGERRTRADKARAQIQRQAQLTYSFKSGNVQITDQPNSGTVPKSQKPTTPAVTITDLFAYDVHLVYQDLIKTVVITAGILAILVGIKVGIR